MYQKIHYLNDCSRLEVQLQQGVVLGTPRFWRYLKVSQASQVQCLKKMSDATIAMVKTMPWTLRCLLQLHVFL
jgi:hypothetical protein